MEAEFAGFDWDAGYYEKCRKHGISVAEIESVFERTLMILPDQPHSVIERRYKAIGKTAAGRHVFLVFTVRERSGRRYIRPIGARFMHRKEVEHFEEENPNL